MGVCVCVCVFTCTLLFTPPLPLLSSKAFICCTIHSGTLTPSDSNNSSMGRRGGGRSPRREWKREGTEGGGGEEGEGRKEGEGKNGPGAGKEAKGEESARTLPPPLIPPPPRRPPAAAAVLLLPLSKAPDADAAKRRSCRCRGGDDDNRAGVCVCVCVCACASLRPSIMPTASLTYTPSPSTGATPHHRRACPPPLPPTPSPNSLPLLFISSCLRCASFSSLLR